MGETLICAICKKTKPEVSLPGYILVDCEVCGIEEEACENCVATKTDESWHHKCTNPEVVALQEEIVRLKTKIAAFEATRVADWYVTLIMANENGTASVEMNRSDFALVLNSKIFRQDFQPETVRSNIALGKIGMFKSVQITCKEYIEKVNTNETIS